MSNLRLRAITEIHRSKKAGVAGDRAKGIAPIPPVTEIVKAKTLFMAKDQDEFDALTSGRYPAAAAAPHEKGEGTAPAKTAKTAKPTKVTEPDSDVALEDMTKAQLVAYAKASEIEVDKKATVPVIRAAIETALEASDEGDEGGEGSDEEDLV